MLWIQHSPLSIGTFIASIQNEETIKPSNFSGIKISWFVGLLLFLYFSNPKLRSRTWVILLKSTLVRGIILSANNPCKFVDTTGSHTWRVFDADNLDPPLLPYKFSLPGGIPPLLFVLWQCIREGCRKKIYSFMALDSSPFSVIFSTKYCLIKVCFCPQSTT